MATKKIALDAGHGLNTAGKQTPNGVKEWTLNDKVRDRVVALLKDYDVDIIHLDNDEGLRDEPLAERVNKYIKAGVDAVVSIHHNAYTGKWNNATGVEVFTDRGPTAKDKELAELIYKNLVSYTGLKGRGVKDYDFAVINQDKVPAVLVEGGFMDGSLDYKVITSEEGQAAYAKAVADAFIVFLKLEKKSTPAPAPTPAKPAAPTVKAGAAVTLTNVPLYASSAAAKATTKKSGTFYLWDAKVTKGRIRITNSKDRVGKAGQITGWVNVSDLGTQTTAPTPAKPASTGFKPYLVKVTALLLNVRAGAGLGNKIKTTVKRNEVYTIVEEKNGWGKLKSGAGWINLAYTKKV